MRRLRDSEIAADFAGQNVVDFLVAWDGGGRLSLRIDIDGMAAALAQKFASVRLQVTNQIATFHAAGTNAAAETRSGSRITV